MKMRRKRLQTTYIWVLLAAGLLFPTVLTAESDELTVEGVIGISSDLLKLSMATLQAKIDFVKQNTGDRAAVNERFNELDEWSQAQSQEVYKRYKTDAEGYRAASAKYKVAIEDYLNGHSEARERLQSLEAKVKALINDLEELMHGTSQKQS